MKTVEAKLLLMLLPFIPLPFFAQEMSLPAKQQNLENLGRDGYGGMIQTYDVRDKETKGNPYFTEEWLVGDVELENGTRYKNVELLYDVYADEILALNKKKVAVILDKGMVQSFRFGKHDSTNVLHFIKGSYLDDELDGVEDHQYVQEVYREKCVLYAINKKLLSKASSKGAYTTGKSYDEFSAIQSKYYFVAPDGKVHRLKPGKPSLLKAMHREKEAVNHYIEDQSLDLSKRDDLVKLIMFYETQLNE